MLDQCPVHEVRELMQAVFICSTATRGLIGRSCPARLGLSIAASSSSGAKRESHVDCPPLAALISELAERKHLIAFPDSGRNHTAGTTDNLSSSASTEGLQFARSAAGPAAMSAEGDQLLPLARIVLSAIFDLFAKPRRVARRKASSVGPGAAQTAPEETGGGGECILTMSIDDLRAMLQACHSSIREDELLPIFQHYCSQHIFESNSVPEPDAATMPTLSSLGARRVAPPAFRLFLCQNRFLTWMRDRSVNQPRAVLWELRHLSLHNLPAAACVGACGSSDRSLKVSTACWPVPAVRQRTKLMQLFDRCNGLLHVVSGAAFTSGGTAAMLTVPSLPVDPADAKKPDIQAHNAGHFLHLRSQPTAGSIRKAVLHFVDVVEGVMSQSSALDVHVLNLLDRFVVATPKKFKRSSLSMASRPAPTPAIVETRLHRAYSTGTALEADAVDPVLVLTQLFAHCLSELGGRHVAYDVSFFGQSERSFAAVLIAIAGLGRACADLAASLLPSVLLTKTRSSNQRLMFGSDLPRWFKRVVELTFHNVRAPVLHAIRDLTVSASTGTPRGSRVDRDLADSKYPLAESKADRKLSHSISSEVDAVETSLSFRLAGEQKVSADDRGPSRDREPVESVTRPAVAQAERSSDMFASSLSLDSDTLAVAFDLTAAVVQAAAELSNEVVAAAPAVVDASATMDSLLSQLSNSPRSPLSPAMHVDHADDADVSSSTTKSLQLLRECSSQWSSNLRRVLDELRQSVLVGEAVTSADSTAASTGKRHLMNHGTNASTVQADIARRSFDIAQRDPPATKSGSDSQPVSTSVRPNPGPPPSPLGAAHPRARLPRLRSPRISDDPMLWRPARQSELIPSPPVPQPGAGDESDRTIASIDEYPHAIRKRRLRRRSSVSDLNALDVAAPVAASSGTAGAGWSLDTLSLGPTAQSAVAGRLNDEALLHPDWPASVSVDWIAVLMTSRADVLHMVKAHRRAAALRSALMDLVNQSLGSAPTTQPESALLHADDAASSHWLSVAVILPIVHTYVKRFDDSASRSGTAVTGMNSQSSAGSWSDKCLFFMKHVAQQLHLQLDHISVFTEQADSSSRLSEAGTGASTSTSSSRQGPRHRRVLSGRLTREHRLGTHCAWSRAKTLLGLLCSNYFTAHAEADVVLSSGILPAISRLLHRLQQMQALYRSRAHLRPRGPRTPSSHRDLLAVSTAGDEPGNAGLRPHPHSVRRSLSSSRHGSESNYGSQLISDASMAVRFRRWSWQVFIYLILKCLQGMHVSLPAVEMLMLICICSPLYRSPWLLQQPSRCFSI